MSLLTLSARLLAGGVLLMAAATAPVATAQGEEKIHELRASPTTVHRGFFDASLKPVLTIESGDIVRLWTATGNPRYFESLGVPKEKIPAELYAAFEGAPAQFPSGLKSLRRRFTHVNRTGGVGAPPQRPQSAFAK